MLRENRRPLIWRFERFKDLIAVNHTESYPATEVSEEANSCFYNTVTYAALPTSASHAYSNGLSIYVEPIRLHAVSRGFREVKLSLAWMGFSNCVEISGFPALYYSKIRLLMKMIPRIGTVRRG